MCIYKSSGEVDSFKSTLLSIAKSTCQMEVCEHEKLYVSVSYSNEPNTPTTENTNKLIIAVNHAGDAGDVSPPIFWLVGTSMGMSPPIFGVAM